MKEQLINFETAKLAKEKGFDEYCFWVYKDSTLYLHTTKKTSTNRHNRYKETVRDLIKNSSMLNAKIPRYSAPTQSLLQKWLREVHGRHIMVCPKQLMDDSIYYYLFKGKTKMNYDDLYDTYEAALEVGLIEMLKSIR